MSDTSSETSSICSTCLEHTHDAPPPRKTLLEKQFEYILDRQRDRVARRKRHALQFQKSSDRLKTYSEPNCDIRSAKAEQYKHACSEIKQYAKDAGINHVPFLSEAEKYVHYSYVEDYFSKTRLLQSELDGALSASSSGRLRPRWYKVFSKEYKIRQLQTLIDYRQHKRTSTWDKERYALDWHLNILLLRDVLPFFLDPGHKAFQEDLVKPLRSAEPQTARRLLMATIQHHPTRSSLFNELSAYDIAKLLHVLFPSNTRQKSLRYLGEPQVRQWVNPLRDVFGPSQLEAILSSIQSYEKSRVSLVLFGPDALELQNRLWDVPGHESRYGSQPDRTLRIFYTYRHDNVEKADRFMFDIEDFFTNGVAAPKPDGEPYRGLSLQHFTYDPFLDYKQAYGRSMRPSSPDPHVYAEHFWSETPFFWTPFLKASNPDSFPDYFGTVTQLPAGLELRGGIDHGMSTDIVRFVATRRTDLPMVFDGMELRYILEIPFLNFTPSMTPAPPTSGSYTITRNLLTWNPSIMSQEPRYRISQRRLARRDRWREAIRRTRHNVYHTHGGKWHRRAVMARETAKFQATFARMAIFDPRFLWECVKEGEITVFWIDLSRWFAA